MFDSILVPVDGSDTARRAAKVGLELAARCDASVHVLHALERRSASSDEHTTAGAGSTERGAEIIQAVQDLDVSGSPAVETHLVEGRPHEVIDAHVDAHEVDLVVMGRRGRSGLAQHLLGSVTERVLRQVDAPVLTVPEGEIRPETGRSWGDVLLTTDGSEVAERAGPHAATLARRLEATLHLVTVVNITAEAGVFDAGGVSESYVERLESENRAALADLAEGLDTTGIDSRQALLNGEAHAELATYADEHEVDLLVMASEGLTNLLGQRIGSTTRRVLQTVERPVLVVPVPD